MYITIAKIKNIPVDHADNKVTGNNINANSGLLLSMVIAVIYTPNVTTNNKPNNKDSFIFFVHPMNMYIKKAIIIPNINISSLP